MRKAIVTGASGFIGGWLTLELLDAEYEVVVVVRNSQKLITEISSNPHVTVIEKDLNNLVPEDFPPGQYNVFFNLAWEGVPPELKNDYHLQFTNISMAMGMLRVCHDIGCDLFIGTGTVAEYALTTDVMDLRSQQRPNDMYGAAKVSTHFFLDVGARTLGQNFIWVVIPSTFGERRLDNNIITYTIKSLIKGEKPLYGNLNQMWDFLYVSEVVRALRLIAEKGNRGMVYGIGSGQYKPLKEYIYKIKEIMNSDVELGIGEIPSQNDRSFSSCVNIYDLIKDTGFNPRVSFEEGITRTVEFWKKLL